MTPEEPTPEEKHLDEFSARLVELKDQCKTREQLIAFIDVLLEGHETKMLENTTLQGYLKTMSMRLSGLRQLCKNFDWPYPARPGWHWIGRQLYAAFL